MQGFLVVFLAIGAYPAPRKTQPKIVGGTVADEGEYPYQASIRFLNAHVCGGSIITQKTILTAAHCDIPVLHFTAVVGTNHIFNGGDSYVIEKIVVHANFSSETVHNDIAVALLKSEIVFSDKVQPIPLGNVLVEGGVECVLTGWGLTKYPSGTDRPIVLMKIQLRTISNEDCVKRHKNTAGTTIVETQICTFTKEGEGACPGDSGGPLAANGSQIGIVSWGIPCGVGYPDVYTRVSSYQDWINENSF